MYNACHFQARGQTAAAEGNVGKHKVEWSDRVYLPANLHTLHRCSHTEYEYACAHISCTLPASHYSDLAALDHMFSDYIRL